MAAHLKEAHGTLVCHGTAHRLRNTVLRSDKRPQRARFCKALRKTAFAQNFVFASFCNRRFTKIRVGTSFLSFFRTRLDSQKLVPTLIFAKKCIFSRFSFSLVSVIAFFRDFHFCKKNDVQLVSSRLAKTRSDSKTDSKF